jgi:hypothetical protein
MRSNEHYPIRKVKRVKTEGKKANEVRTPLTPTRGQKSQTNSETLRVPIGTRGRLKAKTCVRKKEIRKAQDPKMGRSHLKYKYCISSLKEPALIQAG